VFRRRGRGEGEPHTITKIDFLIAKICLPCLLLPRSVRLHALVLFLVIERVIESPAPGTAWRNHPWPAVAYMPLLLLLLPDTSIVPNCCSPRGAWKAAARRLSGHFWQKPPQNIMHNHHVRNAGRFLCDCVLPVVH
jgi:hypothetical protein